MTKAMERMLENREAFQLNVKLLEDSPDEVAKLFAGAARKTLDSYEAIIRCVEENKPFAAIVFPLAPEIFQAMGIPLHVIAGEPLMGLRDVTKDIDECDRIGIASHICTLIRLNVLVVEQGYEPRPTVLVSMTHPCDSVNIGYQIIEAHKDWRNVPKFVVDGGYLMDERSVDYFAGEIKSLVSFLEEHTGRKLDVDRLREVIEASNEQVELWAEYTELRRAVPTPHPSEIQMMPFFMAFFQRPGEPSTTAWFREMVADAEKRVRAKKGALAEERIRIVWYDFRGVWRLEMSSWLEQEWGAIIVSDIWSDFTMTPIDTSNYDSMIRGVAERSLFHIPMVRQFRIPAQCYMDDLVRVIRDYKADCVIWPGHIGHKDALAMTGLMRDVCREKGIPFLSFESDLFDPRVTTVETMQAKISDFFTTMGLGQK